MWSTGRWWPISAAVAVLLRLLDDGACDIGAHLHPWVNPPHDEEVSAHNSYACNLPPGLEYRKLAALTERIERLFEQRPLVYRAGRYGLGARSPALLRSFGYRVDSSVVPHTSFAADGGPDFRGRPDRPHQLTPGVLELPVTAGFVGGLAPLGDRLFPHIGGRLARFRLLERLRLTPEGHSLADLKRLTRALLARGHTVFTIGWHSPSLVPGHTPYVRTVADLAGFVATCEGYFRFFAEEIGGGFMTAAAIAARFLPWHRSSFVNASDLQT